MVHHRVDGVLQFQDFSANIDRDFFGKVAIGHRRSDVGDVSHLTGQISGHRIHRISQIFPSPRHAFHISLTSEFSFGADLAGHTRHFRRERAELVHHRVDGVLQLKNFAFHIDRDLLGQIAARDGGGDVSDIAHLPGQIARHEVHRIGQVFPSSGNAFHPGLTAENSFGTHFARHARDFRSERTQLVHHHVDGVLQLQKFAFDVDRDFFRQVSIRHRGCDRGDVTDLGR